jgi:hypothetical protein
MAAPAFSEKEIDLLQRIAEELIPLQRWINTKKYKPPGNYPWRNGTPIAPKDLGIIEFIEQLFATTERDTRLLARFDQISANPLGLCPFPDVQQWRAARGLASNPRFGIVESGNLLTAGGRPIVRETFYRTYLPLLGEALAAAQAAPEFSWSAFVDALVKDQLRFWPATGPRSSAFMLQFTKDALRAMLSMRNPVSPPVQLALLIELGEHRRVGNSYGPQDAAADVAAFIQRMKEVGGKFVPEAQRFAPTIHPRVGSPPITMREVA